jgi:hypothetical protein
MGVEYRHYLIPETPSFVPSSGVIKRIDALLEKWKLKGGDPVIYNLTQEGLSVVKAPVRSLIFGQVLGVRYLPPEDVGPVVANILGPSWRLINVPDSDRYLYSLTFVAGLDYRIHPSGETWNISLKKPPYEGATKLEPYWEYDNKLYTHAEAFHSTLSTTPPEVEVESNYRDQVMVPKFLGYWRTALVIDCGKDLPEVPDEGGFKIPNKDFIRDVEEALGCKVIEIGEIG